MWLSQVFWSLYRKDTLCIDTYTLRMHQEGVLSECSSTEHRRLRLCTATCWKKVLRMRMWSRASRRALLYCASAPAPVITQGASLCGLLRPLGPFLAAAPFS